MRYQDIHWNHLLRVENYQTLHPFAGQWRLNPYRRLPQLQALADYPDLPCGFEFTAAVNLLISIISQPHDKLIDKGG